MAEKKNVAEVKTPKDGEPAVAFPLVIGTPEPEPVKDPDKVEFGADDRAKLAAYDDMVKRATEQGAQLTSMQQTVDQLLATRLSPPAADVPIVPAAAPEMPDPMQDPEGFRKAVVQQATAEARASIQPVQKQIARDSKLAELRTRFQSAHPELMPYQDLIDAEVLKRAKDAAARGLDPESMLFDKPDVFVKSVAETITARLADIRGVKLEPEPVEDRTGGITGRGAAAGDGKPKPGPKPKGFIQQLTDMQRESGIM